MKKEESNSTGKGIRREVVVFVVLMTLVLGVYAIASRIIADKKARKINSEEDITIMNNVDNLKIDGKNLSLTGWAFKFGNDTDKTNKIQILLRNIDDPKDVKLLKTSRNDRNDVNEFYQCEINYQHSGFVANGTISKKSLDNNVYEVFVRLDYDQKNTLDDGETVYTNTVRTVSTGRYIKQGELINYNPKDFIKPATETNTIINDVVANGTLITYSNEDGIYVYEYDNKLYWIATSEFKFNPNYQTQMAYHIVTTQTEKLPVDRQSYQFDDLSFNFEEKEYMAGVLTPYRVAVTELPSEYAIAYIAIGEYSADRQELSWRRSFHLSNVMNK